MFHRHNTSLKQKFLKNPLSRVYAWYISFWMNLQFHRMQRHHRIAIVVTSISVLLISTGSIIMSFSSDSALAQIRFQIAIRALPECQNGIDDEGDTLIDYPSDPDCTSPSDPSE